MNVHPRPRFGFGRLFSGAVAGATGGALFGLLLMTGFIADASEVSDGILVPAVAQVIGTSSVIAVWAAHVVLSVLLGALFGALVAPRSLRTSMLLGMAYGLLLWAVGAFWLLRTLTGAPLAFDAGAAITLLGHLLFGFTLGAAYVVFHRALVRESVDSPNARWHAWGERQGRV